MSEISKIQGLTILTYLRENGVRVDDDLCSIVPDEVTKKQQKSKAHCVIDLLSDDKEGVFAIHFPDYYNRYPEPTLSKHIEQLRQGFQKFVQQILFERKNIKENNTRSTKTGTVSEIIDKDIDMLISTIRSEWLRWSINDGYKEVIENIKSLLPLLKQKYQNPMLQSDADMMDEEIPDVIPDEYIYFLYDMVKMLCTIYNIRAEQIQEQPLLWQEYMPFMNNVLHITSFIYYDLAWSIFDVTLQDNKYSINFLSRELLSGLNTLYFSIQQAQILKKRLGETPPEKE